MIPQTIEELILIQPNNVTFGQYSLTPLQEDVLTLIIDAIQKHMTKDLAFPRDLFNQPYVEIQCDEASEGKNKAAVIKAVREMYKKEFKFKWVHPSIHKTIESEGLIITTMHNLKDTNRIIINFNPWAIPFLVYYGVGVGGTQFKKSIALSLRGEYTKRIYKMICRWKDKPSFKYSINQLRIDLDLPESYSNTRMEDKVLIPAVEKIKESGSDVWFEYELKCDKPIRGRKPKSDTIYFYIKHKDPKKAGGTVEHEYIYVYNWLTTIWDNMKSSKAIESTDKLAENGNIHDVYSRICYYDDQVANGEKTSAFARNCIKKMLREEYNID
jgi:plasmid replication initiation protein